MSSAQLTTSQSVPARAKARSTRAVRAVPGAPWTPADRLVTAVVIGAGVLLILIAWIGASDSTDWDTQMSWTALSMAGVVVVCIGVGIWLFRGFSRVRAEARAVRRQVAARVARTAVVKDDDITPAHRVTVAGMAHSHRPECLLVRGKTVVAADTSALPPCGVCS